MQPTTTGHPRTLFTSPLLTLLAVLLFAIATVTAHPITASHMWPHICEPLEFKEFLAVSKTTGQPVSLGPGGFYIHFGNARCLFLRVEEGSDDKYAFYHNAFVQALR